MAVRSERPATYDDLRAVPGHLVAELIHGVLHTLPRPRSGHANASSVLGGELHAPFRVGRGGPGGWVILDEPELHMGSDVLVPDLAGWRRERMPELPSVAAFVLAPDWICEVLSPSTSRIDRALKLPVYSREGVRHAWLVDPDAQTLEVLALSADAKWTIVSTFSGDDRVRAVPFVELDLELALLWAR